MKWNYRGWRPSLPDKRDLFRFVQIRADQLPQHVDLSVQVTAEPWATIWDQSQLGSCGANSMGEDIVFAALKQQGLAACPMPSRLFMYYATRRLMGTTSSDSGVDNRTMLKALAQFGWCDESMWPYDIRKYQAMPPAACWAQAQNRRLSSYLAVPQILAQMKATIAGGDPFIYGFSVYQSWESQETETTGVVHIPSGRESQLGGHDVQLVGYSDVGDGRKWPPGHFKFRNHYTSQWGDSGYGYMPYAYATDPHLSGDFWTTAQSGLIVPTPTPTPSPIQRVFVVTGGSITLDGKVV